MAALTTVFFSHSDVGFRHINPFSAMISRENNLYNNSAKFEILQPFNFLFRIRKCERNFMRMHSIKSRFVIAPENYTVYRRVRALFSPEIFAGRGSEGVKQRSLR